MLAAPQTYPETVASQCAFRKCFVRDATRLDVPDPFCLDRYGTFALKLQEHYPARAARLGA
jgi:hypothetical protein